MNLFQPNPRWYHSNAVLAYTKLTALLCSLCLPALHQKPRARLSIQSRRSDFAGPGSDVDGDDNDDNDGDDDLEDDVNADLGSDLSLDEL